MIRLIENEISVDEYLHLREQVKWKLLSERQARLAIENSLFFVKAVDETGEAVGMGRVVGDGAVISYIQDLVVVPGKQGQGIGELLIKRLISYVEQIREKDTTMMLCLMCAKGREDFYKKYGFIARPTEDLGPGMIQYLS